MALSFPEFSVDTKDKDAAFKQAAEYLGALGLRTTQSDQERPWGFFYYIDPSQTEQFISTFYSDVDLGKLDMSLSMQPKLLGIAPHERLSWQYHHRRSEFWRAIGGKFSVVLSETDQETVPRIVMPGDVIEIPQGIRHRGIGGDVYSGVAEIWVHKDSSNPSDEDDIVRVHDDFGR